MQETLLYIGIAGCCLFLLTVYMVLSVRPGKEETLAALIEGRSGVVEHESKLKKAVKNNTWMKKRVEYLNELIRITYDTERTPESITRYQIVCITFGIAVVFIIQTLFKVIPLTVLVALFMSFLTYKPDYSLKSAKKAKFEEFDKTLPSFLNNMLLAMQAGSGVEKAMAMSIQTLDGSIKRDFNNLLIDTTLYKDDIAIAYSNLANRIQTRDCQRFCNVVISGLKNGNRMSDIFAEESVHLNKEQVNKMMEKGSKNKLKSTAISTGLIFMPLLIILIAPMMVTAM